MAASYSCTLSVRFRGATYTSQPMMGLIPSALHAL